MSILTISTITYRYYHLTIIKTHNHKNVIIELMLTYIGLCQQFQRYRIYIDLHMSTIVIVDKVKCSLRR